MRQPSQNVQHHSQTVDHRRICDKAVLHKICNVTHKLLVIEKDLMRLTFQMKCSDSQTSRIGHRIGHDETAFHKMYNINSLSVANWKMCYETACNVTYSLWVIGMCVIKLHFKQCAMSFTCCGSQQKN